MTETNRVELAPDPSTLLESLRDIGYSMSTAVADTIDNSIAAGARHVDLLVREGSRAVDPAIGILDDGCGMSPSVLRKAMRLGALGPLARRGEDDLGRFGLGLKTAAFSQCRRLTVLTSQQGRRACARWDLDAVARAGRWYLTEPSATDGVPWADRLSSTGTLVVWEHLDRMAPGEEGKRQLLRQVEDAESHLCLVFHRFLAGTGSARHVSMRLNGRALHPHDPFHPSHPATQFGQEEVIRMNSALVRIQPVTLPHHSKLTKTEWEKQAGLEGYSRNQGFYLYRNDRLIIHGTWLGLARQSQLTKLSRVCIDIPNTLDADWRIDIKKSSARIPPVVRKRLRGIIQTIQKPSRRTLAARTLDPSAHRLSIWKRTRSRGAIYYSLDSDHPLVTAIAATETASTRRRLRALLKLIESSLPLEQLRMDQASGPAPIRLKATQSNDLRANLEAIHARCIEGEGSTASEVETMLRSLEPYRSNWPLVKRLWDRIDATRSPAA